MLTARDQGLDPDALQMSVTDMLGKFINAQTGIRAPMTLANRKAFYERYAVPVIGSIYASDLKAQDVNALLKRTQKYGASVPLQLYRHLSACVQWAKKQNYITSMAWWSDVERPEYEPGQRHELNAHQLDALYTAALARTDAAFSIITFYSMSHYDKQRHTATGREKARAKDAGECQRMTKTSLVFSLV